MKKLFLLLSMMIALITSAQTTRDTAFLANGDTVIYVTAQSTATFNYPVTTSTKVIKPKVVVIPNQGPICSAGTSQSITLPVNSVTLSGTAKDNDGVIATVAWTQTSGGSSTIVSANTLNTSVINLQQGSYAFNLRVTDDKGATCNSAVNVTVNPAPLPPDTSTGIAYEGYGSQAIGGSNSSTVYHVTNLNASGPGSLNYGIGSNKTIVFDIAGRINARHDIMKVSYLTIDGTTAPFPGIDITTKVTKNGNGMEIGGGSHHIIVKGLVFDTCYNDGICTTEDAHDVLITNCTAYGNGDGNIDLTATAGRNTTAQFCIVGDHIHPSWNDGAGGMLVTTNSASVHHCFFNLKSPAEGERASYVHDRYTPVGTPNCDFRNNIVLNWGRTNATGSGSATVSTYGANTNIVDNYYYTISNVAKADAIQLTESDGHPGNAYSARNVSGNGIDLNSGSRYTNKPEWIVPAPFAVTTKPICQAIPEILQKVGIPQRDANGKRRSDEQRFLNGMVLTGCPAQ